MPIMELVNQPENETARNKSIQITEEIKDQKLTFSCILLPLNKLNNLTLQWHITGIVPLMAPVNRTTNYKESETL